MIILFLIEFDSNMESIRESYMNTVNELNQELLAMKEQYEQLSEEKQILSDQLEYQSVINKKEVEKTQVEKVESDLNDVENVHHALEKLRNSLPISNNASFEEMITFINNLTDENVILKEKEVKLAKDLEEINEQYEKIAEHNKELFFKQQVFDEYAKSNDSWLINYENFF